MCQNDDNFAWTEMIFTWKVDFWLILFKSNRHDKSIWVQETRQIHDKTELLCSMCQVFSQKSSGITTYSKYNTKYIAGTHCRAGLHLFEQPQWLWPLVQYHAEHSRHFFLFLEDQNNASESETISLDCLPVNHVTQ